MEKKRKIFFFVTIVILTCVVYTTYTMMTKNNTPLAKITMTEQLLNGQDRIVDSFTVEDEKLEWFNKKQSELTLLVADQTKLERNNIAIILGPMINSDNMASYSISCSIVLKTELTYEEEVIENIVDGIISTISEDAFGATISANYITIVNGNGEMLN